MNLFFKILISILLAASAVYAVEKNIRGRVLVEVKNENGHLKVSVKNNTSIPIGYIKFTLENLDESGEISFEDLPKNKLKSRLVRVRSKSKMKVKTLSSLIMRLQQGNPRLRFLSGSYKRSKQSD